jgi:pyruvate dehydrogenase complex dehydrogenase (E1) component
VGVDQFGQSGAIVDLYEIFDLLPDRITNAALTALTL